jgi:hypothetical protein
MAAPRCYSTLLAEKKVSQMRLSRLTLALIKVFLINFRPNLRKPEFLTRARALAFLIVFAAPRSISMDRGSGFSD